MSRQAKSTPEEIADEDYEVGYGRPPKATQFKKGQSGNPNGRKKGSTSINGLMKEILSRKVSVNENGEQRRIEVMEAILTRVAMNAAKGDIRAIREVLALAKDAGLDVEPVEQITRIERVIVYPPSREEMEARYDMRNRSQNQV